MRALRPVVLAVAALGALAACSQAGAAGKGGKVTGAEVSQGRASAKVSVVEYASVTCSHCARFDQEVFPAFKAKYIDSGKVRYTFREFLTPPEQLSAAGFLLARCAGRPKYFAVVESLFRTQATLFETQDPKAWLYNTGKSAGLSEAQIQDCLKDETALTALQARVQKAIDVEKIDGTPTFIINGKKLDSGEKTLAQLDAAIQPLLTK